jgi:hypothetical protein
MTSSLITPLRKTTLEGALYVRQPGIEARLAELVPLPLQEISARCAVEDDHDPNYIPSECLMYLVRANRTCPPGICFENIYKALLARVMRRLPGEDRTSLTDTNIRAETLGQFAELLAADRVSSNDKLDYYEVRFDSALRSLRENVARQAYRERDRAAVLESDLETGELSKEVERAAVSGFNLFEPEKLDDADYRSRLAEAIDTLPAIQKAIIEMMNKNIPIDSKDPRLPTISKILGKAEKTIRLQRDRAYQTLRDILKEGEYV